MKMGLKLQNLIIQIVQLVPGQSSVTKKNVSRSTNDNVVEKYTVPKINNINKYDSNDLTIKNKKDEKLYIEDKKPHNHTQWKPLHILMY